MSSAPRSGADRSRPSLETTKGEAHSAQIAEMRAWAERMLSYISSADANWRTIHELARDVIALTDSAGELVRLRDSQREALEASLRDALDQGIVARLREDAAANRRGWFASDELMEAAADLIERACKALPSSSVSPSLTETGMGSGQERPAPEGEAKRV